MAGEIFDFWQSMGEFGQQCLGRAIGPTLLDETGCVREPLLKSIDRLLITHLRDQSEESIKGGALGLALGAHQRWINTSAMQKAIRRGQAERAARHAVAGVSLDPQHTLRRLAVCALEDVGIGNLSLVSMALAMAGSGRNESSQATSKWAAHLAKLLAESPKSRLACDLISLMDYGSGAGRSAAGWTSPGHRPAGLGASSPPAGAQMVAACGLGGCRLAPQGMLPSGGKAARSRLMRAFVQARAPLLLYYVVDRAAGRLRDAMFVSLLPIWHSLQSEPTLRIEASRVPASAEIGSFAAEAFDMHTRSGRLALQRLVNECPSVRDLIVGLSEADALTVVGHAVFIVEGGLLDRRVTYPFADEVRVNARHSELAFAGVLEAQRQSELLAAIGQNLPKLNELRRRASSFS